MARPTKAYWLTGAALLMLASPAAADDYVHTGLSLDAYILSIRRTPDDAYRYALGESVRHASGYDIQWKGGALDSRNPEDLWNWLNSNRAKGIDGIAIPVAANIDTKTCRISQRLGAPELKVAWRDPDFNAKRRAFYYVRVLENSTCHWSMNEANRLGKPVRKDLPLTIQERAWSSPIWVRG